MRARYLLAAALSGCQAIWGIEPLSGGGAGGSGGSGGSGGTGGSIDCAGLTDCTGKCVDLQTSAEHCGACGHVCEGPCNQGLCEVETLLPNMTSANDVAVEGGFAWVTDGGAGTVVRFDLSQMKAEVVASNEPGCYHVGVGGGYVYWSTPNGVRYNLSTPGAGLPLDADPGIVADDLAVRGTHGLWSSSNNGVRFYDIPGQALGTPKAMGLPLYGVALVNNAAFWVLPSKGDVVMAGVDGAGEVTLYGGRTGLGRIAASSAYVYFADSAGIQRGTTASDPLETMGPDPVVSSLWADEAGVYWTSPNGVFARRNGDAAPFQLSLGGDAIGITTDDTHVYWVTFTELRRVPK